MTIKSTIKVGNNSEIGFDFVEVETSCHGFITLNFKVRIEDFDHAIKLELSREELREFLARTCPEFVTAERYKASATLP